MQATAGSRSRAALELESGGSRRDGLDWCIAANRFHDGGWRPASRTAVAQLFGKVGIETTDSRLSLSAALFLNLEGRQRIDGGLSVCGNAYDRRIKTSTRNGDVNAGSLGRSVYQPSAAEQAALSGAGYSGFPASGATAANTPYPRWRCIASALLGDEPATACSGVVNTKDDILFAADNQAGFGYFKNFGKTRRRGLEGGFRAQATAALDLGFNYSFLGATYRSTEVVDGSSSSNDAAASGSPGVEGVITVKRGDRMALIPRHILKLFDDLQLGPAWAIGADLTAIGNSYARGNENNQHRPDGVYYLGPGRSPGYAVLNLSVDYRAPPDWSFFLHVGNLFDRKYATAAQLGATAFDANGNFLARPFAANANGERPLQHSTCFAPGAPRSFALGVKHSFD